MTVIIVRPGSAAALLQDIYRTTLHYSFSLKDKEYKAVESKIKNYSVTQLRNLKILSVPVGKIALFEAIIKYKKNSLSFSDFELEYYRIKVKHAVRSVFIARETLANSNPKFIFVFGAQYAVGGAFSEFCIRHGVKVYAINFSSNISEITRSVTAWDWGKFKLDSPAYSSWSKNHTPASKTETMRAQRHLKRLYKSKSVFTYSSIASGKSTRKFFKILPEQKIVLLAMSSYDEVFANSVSGLTKNSYLNGEVFSNQMEWVMSTIKFIAKMPNVALIIRPHPRELPNVRDQVESSHSKDWGSLLRDLPPNIFVDWPHLRFSIYDHFQEVTCVLTGWSSVGIEAMLSGIPCVTYDSKLPDFPREIHLTGDTKDIYFKNILKSLEDSDSNLIRSKALGWFSYAFSKGTIQLNGSLHNSLILRNFFFTRRLADTLEYRFAHLSKRYQKIRRFASKDEHKLLSMLETTSDHLFDEVD